MTLISDVICAKAKGFCTKKVLIYVFVASSIVTLLVAAVVVVYLTKWANNLDDDLEDWSYKRQDEWPTLCKTSRIQSPIALTQKYAYKQELPPIKLENFGVFSTIEIENNGHTVMVYPGNTCKCRKPKLSGGRLTKNYTMENIHFHWPSEHTIDGLMYDLEAHFVFYADKYKTFQEALKYPHSLAVVAVLFTEITYTTSDNFRILADAVKTVCSKPGEPTEIKKSINMHDFLPYDHETYFTYSGSLTTPSCAEYVDWIVFKNHSNIAYVDYKDLTNIYSKHHQILDENNRSLQDINERVVYLQDTER